MDVLRYLLYVRASHKWTCRACLTVTAFEIRAIEDLLRIGGFVEQRQLLPLFSCQVTCAISRPSKGNNGSGSSDYMGEQSVRFKEHRQFVWILLFDKVEQLVI
jgi:hypothetical protein